MGLKSNKKMKCHRQIQREGGYVKAEAEIEGMMLQAK